MFDIVGKRYWFFGLSILIILAGLIGWLINGFNLDIQFKGGTEIEIEVDYKDFNDKAFDEKKAAALVKDATGKLATGIKSKTLNADAGKDIYILTLKIADALTGDEQNKVDAVLRDNFKIKEDAQMNVSTVEPSIGKELMAKGLQAVFWASVLIVIYIAIRFRVMSGWSAAIFAVIALLHDAAIMLSVYTLFRIPLNDAFIAAVLTILGYSMNDTVIIYDRIRENSNLLRKVDLKELVNKSILQTLARSINTMATSVICVITVYIFARVYNINTMADFAFPLIVGLLSGAYSSIFIASPLWVMWRKSQHRRNARPAKA